MPKEYILPPLEDIYGSTGVKIKIYENEESPFKIGSLEREAFTSISNWDFYMNQSGSGIAYRQGIKDNMLDLKGNIVKLFIHFGHPISVRDFKTTPEFEIEYYKKLNAFAKAFAMEVLKTNPIQRGFTNFGSIVQHPTEWMLEELRENLKDIVWYGPNNLFNPFS